MSQQQQVYRSFVDLLLGSPGNIVFCDISFSRSILTFDNMLGTC